MSTKNAVEMEQQQSVYVQQPQRVQHPTITTTDPSETSAMLMLIFGTLCCPFLCCVNGWLYSKCLLLLPLGP